MNFDLHLENEFLSHINYDFLSFREKQHLISELLSLSTFNLEFYVYQVVKGKLEWLLDLPLEDMLGYLRYSSLV